MNISSKSRYALQALVELQLRTGGEARPVTVADLAGERRLPAQFLEQVFAALRRAGLLRSHRGVGGGFTFARSPAQVSALDVVVALDGPPGAAPPARGRQGGHGDPTDPAGVWHEADAAFAAVLAGATIADLAERERQLRVGGAPMYEI